MLLLSTAKGMGLISSLGTKIPESVVQKKKKKTPLVLMKSQITNDTLPFFISQEAKKKKQIS